MSILEAILPAGPGPACLSAHDVEELRALIPEIAYAFRDLSEKDDPRTSTVAKLDAARAKLDALLRRAGVEPSTLVL